MKNKSILLCQCGCGKPIEPKPWHKYRKEPPRFLHGHGAHLAARKRGNRVLPRPGEAPTGICECGCGRKTGIAKSTCRRRRYFRGYPLPFIRGHHARGRGKDSVHWKGGRIKQRGYVLLYAPNHPDADPKGYVREHRLIASKMLGRRLKPNEHVHHINGIRDDNRPDNLVVLTSAEHSKVHDKAAHMRKGLTKADYSKAGKKGAEARWNKPKPM